MHKINKEQFVGGSRFWLIVLSTGRINAYTKLILSKRSAQIIVERSTFHIKQPVI